MENQTLKIAQDESFVHNVEVSASMPLEDVLTEICRTQTVNGQTTNLYDYRHTWNITIASGYSAQITRRWPGIRCSISIIGAEEGGNKIYFSKSIITNNTLKDSIFGILGESTEKRVKVYIENLQLMPIGAEEGLQFSPSATTIFNDVTYLFKIYYAEKVTFCEVASTLINGNISNIDIRGCSNILINRCKLINYNGVFVARASQAGSNIMLRGNMDNVLITNCTFEKYGNDEIISVFGDSIPENNFASGIPFAEQEYIFRRNIRITRNNFRYLRPEINGAVVDSNIQDVMISFDGYYRKEYNRQKDVYWENVWVAYNTFEANDYVRRFFSIFDVQSIAETFGFRIFGNTLKRSYRAVVPPGEKVYSADFELRRTAESPTSPNQAVEIAYNKVYVSVTMVGTVGNHKCVHSMGVNANIHNNLLDCRGFKVENDNTVQNEAPTLLRCENFGHSINFRDNKCLNVDHLASIENIPTGQSVNLNISNNYVQGNISIVFVKNIPEANLIIEQNFFDSASYYLLTNNSALSGSLWVSNNVWYTHATATSTKAAFCYLVGDVKKIDRVAFIGNVVKGERTVENTDLPPASEFVTARNLPEVTMYVKK